MKSRFVAYGSALLIGTALTLVAPAQENAKEKAREQRVDTAADQNAKQEPHMAAALQHLRQAEEELERFPLLSRGPSVEWADDEKRAMNPMHSGRDHQISRENFYSLAATGEIDISRLLSNPDLIDNATNSPQTIQLSGRGI